MNGSNSEAIWPLFIMAYRGSDRPSTTPVYFNGRAVFANEEGELRGLNEPK